MPVPRFYPGELFELANDIEEALASEWPDEIPIQRQRITAAFGWARVIAVTCSFFVIGILYTHFGLSWLHDTLVSSVANVGVAMGATVAGMAVLLLACPAGRRRSLRRGFALPLGAMLGLVLGVAAAVGLAALFIYLEIELFKWLVGQGLVVALVAAVLYGPAAILVTLELLTWLAVQAGMSVKACLRHWFGCGQAHPMLPALATLAFAVAHMAIGAWETAARGTDAVVPTDVQLTISVGGPACVVVLALVELRLLAAEGIRLDEHRA